MTQILHGKNAVLEALKSGRRQILEIFMQESKKNEEAEMVALCSQRKIILHLVDRKKIEALSGADSHQGVAARAGDFQYSDLESLLKGENRLFVVCDSLKDPQNFGTICRSAHFFGADAIILNKDNSVEVTPAVSRASAGAVEHLSVVRVTNIVRTLQVLKENGFWIYAADIKGDIPLQNLKPSPKMVLVLGSEGEGIRPLILKNCDYRCAIPQARPFDSLNVAQAASIFLYEIFKKRGA